MHAPIGGCAAPLIAANTMISPVGADAGSSAMAAIAAADTGAPTRSTRVWPRRSTTRASAGLEMPSASA